MGDHRNNIIKYSLKSLTMSFTYPEWDKIMKSWSSVVLAHENLLSHGIYSGKYCIFYYCLYITCCTSFISLKLKITICIIYFYETDVKHLAIHCYKPWWLSCLHWTFRHLWTVSICIIQDPFPIFFYIFKLKIQNCWRPHLLTVLLRYNSHTVQSIHLKCTIQFLSLFLGL